MFDRFLVTSYVEGGKVYFFAKNKKKGIEGKKKGAIPGGSIFVVVQLHVHAF